MGSRILLGFAGPMALVGRAAFAAPAHDICADLGADVGVGIASYSASGDWPEQAELAHGVDWRFLYLYLVPTEDPAADREWFLRHKEEIAESIGAIPVFTFYQLLQRGQQSGLSGTEPEVVQAALQDPTLMRAYFDDFVFVLEAVAAGPTPPIVHVEPDSWGFMMWAMGMGAAAEPPLAGVPPSSGGSLRWRCWPCSEDATASGSSGSSPSGHHASGDSDEGNRPLGSRVVSRWGGAVTVRPADTDCTPTGGRDSTRLTFMLSEWP